MSAGAASPDVSVQPCVAATPPRASTPTTTRWPCVVEHVFEELGIGQRGGADHDALGAGVQGALDGEAVAKPAAHLDARVRLGGDPAHVLEVLRRAGAGAIEVDDVEPLGPLLGPALRRVERVGVVRGLPLVVALHEPHGMAAPDIDCRVEDQAGTGR